MLTPSFPPLFSSNSNYPATKDSPLITFLPPLANNIYKTDKPPLQTIEPPHKLQDDMGMYRGYYYIPNTSQIKEAQTASNSNKEPAPIVVSNSKEEAASFFSLSSPLVNSKTLDIIGEVANKVIQEIRNLALKNRWKEGKRFSRSVKIFTTVKIFQILHPYRSRLMWDEIRILGNFKEKNIALSDTYNYLLQKLNKGNHKWLSVAEKIDIQLQTMQSQHGESFNGSIDRTSIPTVFSTD
jgi:hypothetical protein